MRVVQALLSIFLVAVSAAAVAGILWWDGGKAPQPIAHYELGGKVILGVLVAGALFGLYQIWKPIERTEA